MAEFRQLPAVIADQYSSWACEAKSVHPGNSAMYRMSREDDVRFLKVVRKGWFPSAEAEAVRTIWAHAYVPVPEIIDHGMTEDTTWFVSRALHGDDATSQHFRHDLPSLVYRLGKALRQLHSIPHPECPFSFDLDDALAHAGERLRQGLIDPARDFHPEHADLSADAAVRRLIEDRPDGEDLVVCHGDFCVPNILFRGNELAGFVDLGELGVADRWWDLAVATWSITWNFGAGYEDAFLQAYGVEMDEHRLRYYRLLYDVVS